MGLSPASMHPAEIKWDLIAQKFYHLLPRASETVEGAKLCRNNQKFHDFIPADCLKMSK